MLNSKLTYEGEDAYKCSMSVKKFLEQEGTLISKEGGFRYFINQFQLNKGGIILKHNSSKGGYLTLKISSGSKDFLGDLESMLKDNFPQLKP